MCLSKITELTSLSSFGKSWIPKNVTFVSTTGFIFVTMAHTPTHHTKVPTMVWSQVLLLSYHGIIWTDLLHYFQRIVKSVFPLLTLKVCGIQPIAIYGPIFQLLLISSNWGNISSPMNGNSAINTNTSKFCIFWHVVFNTSTPYGNYSPTGIVTKSWRVRKSQLVDVRLLCSCKAY